MPGLLSEGRIDDGHKQERCHGCHEETADDGAPQGGVLLAALAQAERHGEHADDHGEGRHEHGAKAGVARLKGRFPRVLALVPEVVREGDQEDRVGGRHADAHDGPHQRRDAQGRSRQEEDPQDSAQGSRERHDDDEWVQPRLEVHHHQEIDEPHGKDDADPEPDEGGVHALRLPPQLDAAAARKLWRVLPHELPDLAGDRAQVPSVHVGIDVKYRLDVVVADHLLNHGALDRGHVAEHLRRGGSPHVADREGLQGLNRVDLALGRLGSHEVLDPLGAQPVGRRDLRRAAQGDEDVVGNVLLREADLLGPCPVDAHGKRRGIHDLMDVHVHGPRDLGDLFRKLGDEGVVVGGVAARDLQVDRRRKAEIEDLAHDVRGLGEEGAVGKLPVKARPDLPDIGPGGAVVACLKRHEYLAVCRAHGSGVAEGKAGAPVRQAYVVDDGLKLRGGHHLANDVLDPREVALGLLDARSVWRPHVEPELPRVNEREEVPAKERVHAGAHEDDGHHEGEHHPPVVERHGRAGSHRPSGSARSGG